MKGALVLLMLVSKFLVAQTNSVEGNWLGAASKIDEQGDTIWHKYSLQLTQTGAKISGTATVHRATMACKGVQEKDGSFSIRETKILKQTKMPEYEFCLKTLIFGMDEARQTLVGFWEGISRSGRCDPGYVLVRRQQE